MTGRRRVRALSRVEGERAVPINYSTAHEESIAELINAIKRDLAHPAHAKLAGMLQKVHDLPTEHRPHPIYAVGPEDIISGDVVAKARLIGWRYLDESKDRKNQAVEVNCEPDGSNHRFAGFNRGPFVEGMVETLDQASHNQKIEAGHYFVSLLRIHELYVVALWLRAQEAVHSDLFIALEPTPEYLTSWPTVYTVAQFEEALKDEASRAIERRGPSKDKKV